MGRVAAGGHAPVGDVTLIVDAGAAQRAMTSHFTAVEIRPETPDTRLLEIHLVRSAGPDVRQAPPVLGHASIVGRRQASGRALPIGRVAGRTSARRCS